MGVYDWDRFRQELKFELGERADLSSHTDLSDLYGKWINTAYMRLTTLNRFWKIKRDFYFPELHTEDASQSTIDGRDYIEKPDDCLYVEGVWDRTNDVILNGIGWQTYKNYTGRADTDAENEPKEWTRRGDKIHLYRTPDDTYEMTIYYRKRVNLLDGSSYDATEIGEEWDEAVLKLAKVIALMKLRDYEVAQQEKAEWLDITLGLMGIYDKEERDRAMKLKIDAAAYNYEYK